MFVRQSPNFTISMFDFKLGDNWYTDLPLSTKWDVFPILFARFINIIVMLGLDMRYDTFIMIIKLKSHP